MPIKLALRVSFNFQSNSAHTIIFSDIFDLTNQYHEEITVCFKGFIIQVNTVWKIHCLELLSFYCGDDSPTAHMAALIRLDIIFVAIPVYWVRMNLTAGITKPPEPIITIALIHINF